MNFVSDILNATVEAAAGSSQGEMASTKSKDQIKDQFAGTQALRATPLLRLLWGFPAVYSHVQSRESQNHYLFSSQLGNTQ